MKSSPPGKRSPGTPLPVQATQARLPKPAPASQLRAQTRKVLAKHYRAKYGVR